MNNTEWYDESQLVSIEGGEAYLYPGHLSLADFMVPLYDIVTVWEGISTLDDLDDYSLYHGYVIVGPDYSGELEYTFCAKGDHGSKEFTVLVTPSFRVPESWNIV